MLGNLAALDMGRELVPHTPEIEAQLTPTSIVLQGHSVRALGKMAGLKTTKRPLHVENVRGSFYVGQGAHNCGRPVESLDFDRLTGSPEMLALFHGAMTQYLQK